MGDLDGVPVERPVEDRGNNLGIAVLQVADVAAHGAPEGDQEQPVLDRLLLAPASCTPADTGVEEAGGVPAELLGDDEGAINPA